MDARTSQGIPADLVEALHAIFGRHHARAVHAKGVLLAGAFRATAEARALSAARLFDGAIDHVRVRFSNFAGVPDISDTDPGASPRGLAIKFRLPDGTETDIVAHSFDGFPSATPDEFLALLRALAASGPTAPKPTPLDEFLAGHPAAKTFLATQKGPPVSWATLTYFGVNTFRFVDRLGRGTHVRYRFVPRDGEQLLDAAAVETKGPSYLSEEIATRVAKEPIILDWFAQVADRSDVVDDPSIAWPESRRQVLLGTIELVRLCFDQAAEERATVFAPGNVPSGIEPADPMIGVRDAAYALSFRERG